MKSRWSRREFLKTTTAAVMLGAAEKALGATALQRCCRNAVLEKPEKWSRS